MEVFINNYQLNNINTIENKSIYIDDTVSIGKNVTIHPNNIIKGTTIIEDNVVLGPNNYICDSVVKSGTTIEFSYIEKSTIHNNCQIGPYSRIRPNSIIGPNCKIGNFVEIKNSTLGENTKASHLAYVGDCDVGNNCNIGCGAVFVNYNGKHKNRSIVGNNCFIGSNVNIVAPVRVADDSYICAGTTLTINTQPQDFVIGRCRETVKRNYANKYKKESK